MMRQLLNMERLQHQSGVFDGFNVSGYQHMDERGEVGWLMTAWPGGNPVNDYWVANGRFYNARIDLGRDGFLIEVFNENHDIDPKEKTAILNALAKWDR
jgi:hypothetical protein